VNATRARGSNVLGGEYLHQLRHLHELALALLSHARLQYAAQHSERFGKVPTGQGCSLIELIALARLQCQVMQWVEDESFRP
jgi:hypothetical protein